MAAISPEALAKLRAGGVALVSYDPVWPLAFEEAAAAIMATAGDLLTGVEHVGSTAVPGLAAKPVLDLMPGLHRQSDGTELAARLAPLGYEYRGEFGIPGRHYFTRELEVPGAVYKHNVHCYETGHPEWVRHIVFRDAMRADPGLRDAYQRLKEELALAHPGAVQDYADAKSEFVEAVIARFGGPARE